MSEMSAYVLYPVILIAGALQAWGPPMNGALREFPHQSLACRVWCPFCPSSPSWGVFVLCRPRTGCRAAGRRSPGMPWWAPLGGLVGAFAVVSGIVLRRYGRGRRVCRADHHGQHPDVARD